MTWSPPTNTPPIPVVVGGTGSNAVISTPTGSSWAGWDVSGNFAANNFLPGFASTITSGGTTTLSASSGNIQHFTGTLNQTLILPPTSTLSLGQEYVIRNLSSGTVTVEASDSSVIQVMDANTSLAVTCTSISITSSAAWSSLYVPVTPFTFPLSPVLGGTGVSNNVLSTTTINGAHPLAWTLTASTSLTLPASGTLTNQSQVQSSAFNYGIDTGVADAYVVNLTPAITSLTDGLLITFTALNQNNTDAPTLTVNGITKTITNQFGGQLISSDITGFTPSFLIFSEQQDYWMLLNAYISIATPFGIQFANYIAAVDTAVVANAYNVELEDGVAGLYSPQSGSQVAFSPNHTNTGASTLVVNGQGPLNIIMQNGSSVLAGYLNSTKTALLTYGTNNAGVLGWILTNPQGVPALNLAGNLTTLGAFASTFTMTGATNVTFPTSGTLATTSSLGDFTFTGDVMSNATTNANISIVPNGTGGTIAGSATRPASGDIFSVAKASSGGVLSVYNYNSVSPATINVVKSNSSTVGGFGVVTAGQTLGTYAFQADTGSSYQQRSYMRSAVTTVAGFIGSNLTLATSAPGALGNVVALTISDSQVVTLANALPVASGGTGITAFGTGVATALGQNVTGSGGIVLATSPTTSNLTDSGAITAASFATTNSAGNFIISSSPTVNLGSLILQAANSSGNFNGFIKNTSLSAQRTWTLPDATGTIALTSGASGIVNSGTAGQLAYYAGSGATISGTNAGTGVVTALGVNTNSTGGFAVETDGTFTPVLAFGGASVGITYSTQSGYYSRVGNVVTFVIGILLSNKGSSTGIATITGLPVTARIGPSPFEFVARTENVIFTSNVAPQLLAGSTTLQILQFPTSTTASFLTDTAFSNSSNILITGTYLV